MRKMLEESPSQTAGPYVHLGCTPTVAGYTNADEIADLGSQMINGNPTGVRVALTITVFDGAGEPLRDGMIEIWQPGPDGSFGPTDGFCHWGRQAMHMQTGLARFDTLKPGAPEGQSPHFLIWITARGINLGLTTRIYLPDAENKNDPVFKLSEKRCNTLIAQSVDGGYHHNIHLQGEQETIFFNV